QRIRDRVSAIAPSQRPEDEGASGRVLFELDEPRAGTTFTVVPRPPDRVSLPGAALLGVAVGDRFAITPAGTAEVSDATIVAQATVSRTDGAVVEATVQFCAGHSALPAVAEAHPRATSMPPQTVVVDGDGPWLAAMRAAV